MSKKAATKISDPPGETFSRIACLTQSCTIQRGPVAFEALSFCCQNTVQVWFRHSVDTIWIWSERDPYVARMPSGGRQEAE